MSMTAATLVSVLRWISDLCMLGAMLGCVYTLFASAFVLGFRPREKRPARADIPVTSSSHCMAMNLACRHGSPRFASKITMRRYKSSSALRMPPIRRLRSRSGFRPPVPA
jgi:hypothetical protein